VTVLPALLSKLGDRIEKGRVPLLRRAEGGGRFWNAVLTPVLRRPKLATALAGGLLVVLALPAFSMKTVMPGVSDLPRELPIIQTYERIQAAFPGGPLPAQIVVRSDELASERVATAVRELRAEALATGLMDDPVHFQVIGNGTVGIVSVPLAGDGQDALSNRALETLRERVIPATLGKLDGVEVAVGGDTAVSKDFSDTMKARAPVVFAFVLGLAFLLLLVTFRSIVIPLKAILLNLLSVGAAYGALVALFQWGWGESLLGFESTGGITSWLPVFLFVVLFGLSMDYHVFILSRVREAYDNGMTTHDAVACGIRSTAGVVTSAALVMVLVFSIFGTLSQVSMKQAGVGLAVAVFLDATIVRAVLLPATMKLLGEANWWLPKRLEWLPKVAVEPAPAR
jgi:RND superfamily putative drug exporter